jgi:hypothetical protein
MGGRRSSNSPDLTVIETTVPGLGHGEVALSVQSAGKE